jgi:glycosyltransferase involved in cell wall biosynthesis
MRILHVIQEFGSGGAEQVVRQLCTAGLTAGDEFAVACSGATVLLDGVPHLPLPMLHRRPSQVLAASWRLRDHVRDWNPDVVHAHNPGMAAITALATLRGAVRPGMVTIHGVRPADDIATSRLLRCTGLPVVACGAGVAATLRAHGTEPLRTIVNGVGPCPRPAAIAALRREWGLASGLRLIVAVGRLMPQKRHDLAIGAMVRLPDAALVIVGDGTLRPNLERQIEELGLSGRVRLMGARTDARAILGAADVVVQPSDWEGLPLVVLEAMSAARPVVATRVRGLRELIRDGVDGLLVPSGDADALATAIATILTDHNLACRLGGAAAARFEHEFSEAAMVSAYRSLWLSLATRRPL